MERKKKRRALLTPLDSAIHASIVYCAHQLITHCSLQRKAWSQHLHRQAILPVITMSDSDSLPIRGSSSMSLSGGGFQRPMQRRSQHQPPPQPQPDRANAPTNPHPFTQPQLSRSNDGSEMAATRTSNEHKTDLHRHQQRRDDDERPKSDRDMTMVAKTGDEGDGAGEGEGSSICMSHSILHDDDGFFISSAEFESIQSLKASHDALQSEVQDERLRLAETENKLARMQRLEEEREKERVEENARSHALIEQLREDLAHETQQHNQTKVQLAHKAQELQTKARESDLLRTSLQHHERELTATNDLIHSLRSRIDVLEALQADMEKEREGEAERIVLLDDMEAEDERKLSLVIPSDNDSSIASSTSALIPALSSASSPLHLRRSHIHSLLLSRTITRRTLVRVQAQLQMEQQRNEAFMKQVARQWKIIEELEQQVRQTERIKQEVDKGEAEIAGHEATMQQQVSSFTSAAGTSTLLLQLHSSECEVKQLQHANRAFLYRFYWRCFALLVLCLLLRSCAI